MREADGFNQVFVSAEGACQSPPDLGNLQRMRQARAEIIAFEVDKNLRLIFQSAKCRGVQNAVTVALKGCAVVRLAVQIGASLRILASHSITGKAFIFNIFQLLSSKKHSQPF